MTRSIRRLLLAALAAASSPTPASAQQALVHTYREPSLEAGQAYLTHHAGRCLALLPTHVVAETGSPAFLREGTDGLRGEAIAVHDLGDDLSLAELAGSVTRECGFGLGTLSRAVTRRIRESGVVVLRSVNGDGTLGQVSVAVVDDDGERWLRVRPTNSADQLRKGQSGSLLLAGKAPVGMLLSVNARHGVGKILRFDAALTRVDAFLAAAEAAAPAGRHGPPAPGTGAAAPRVIGWTALPVDARHRAENLVATGDAPPWIARPERWPAEIELELRDGDKLAIAGVELDGTRVPDPEALPRQLELLVSVSESGRRWRSVWSGELLFHDGRAGVALAPQWARQLLLRFHGGSAGATLALRRVRVRSP